MDHASAPMEQRTRRSPLALPHVLARGMGGEARRHADDADAGGGDAAALAARPARHERGRGDLPAAVAAAVALCRRRRSGCSRRSRASSAPRTARCRTSSASRARWRWASRPPRACCRRCSKRWPNVPKVDLVTTDGFLYPNAILEREGLMEKKGFPESYDLPALLRFLSDIKAGRRPARAPIYSHLVYDVVPNQWIEIDRPDILVVEGLNVLQTGRLPRDGKAIPFVSDFFDFSIYLDADEDVLLRWYVDRFLTLRGTAFTRSEIILPPLLETVRYRGGARPRPRSGTGSTSSICTRTSSRRASAPTSSSRRARATWSRKWRCGSCRSRQVPAPVALGRRRRRVERVQHDADRHRPGHDPQHLQREVDRRSGSRPRCKVHVRRVRQRSDQPVRQRCDQQIDAPQDDAQQQEDQRHPQPVAAQDLPNAGEAESAGLAGPARRAGSTR